MSIKNNQLNTIVQLYMGRVKGKDKLMHIATYPFLYTPAIKTPVLQVGGINRSLANTTEVIGPNGEITRTLTFV